MKIKPKNYDVSYLASRIDRCKTEDVRTYIQLVKDDQSGERMEDLRLALAILEAPLSDGVRVVLETELPGLELPS